MKLAPYFFVVCAAAFSRVAHAEDAQAELLYQEGRRAALAKDWPTACKKFKESNDREPAPGTLLNLADCEENRGQLRDAYAHFEAAAAAFPSGPTGTERAAYARERALAVDKHLARLTVRAPAFANLSCDGVAIEASKAVALDPGEHVIVVHAPGRAEVRSTLKLAQGEARQIEIDAGPPALVTADPVHNAHDSSPPPKAGSALKTAGFVSLGVAAVGLGVGVVGGILTVGANQKVKEECAASACSASGLDAQRDGKMWSTVSTVGFVGTGVFAAAGGAMLIVASMAPKSRTPASLSVTPTNGGSTVTLMGTF